VPFAAVFPGQGAAVPGAGRNWVDHPAWQVVSDAETLLDRPLARLLLEAEADELSSTRESQLAVLLTSLVAWTALTEALADLPDETRHPVAYAGHSLGQITALLASGAVERSDGLRLAAQRADLSQKSADTHKGRMAALVGATVEQAEAACTGHDAWMANDNAPGQVVIAGTPDGLDAASEQARTLGVRRVMPLDVGHAFHTPLLADAADGLRPLLTTLRFTEPKAPVVANTDALAHTDPSCWPDQLTRHLVEPVRWQDCQQTLAALGATTLIEVGPGKVLAGLAKRALPDVPVLNVATPDDVTAVASQIAPQLVDTTTATSQEISS
jgi:[acyl-carrier-protein] S-malonyltransferase